MNTHLDAKAIITKARAKIALNPNTAFYASILFRREIKEDPTCNSMWTDGKTIGYNPKFVETEGVEKVVGVLIHEVMHIANKHHLRRESRNPARWNIAADYAINPMIVEEGFLLPDGSLINPHFSGHSSEHIYNLLPEDNRHKDGPGPSNSSEDNSEDPTQPNDKPNDKPNQNSNNNPSDDGSEDAPNPNPENFGEVRDSPDKDTPKELQEREVEVEIQQAYRAQKMVGKVSGAMERLAKEADKSKVPWKRKLARFMGSYAKDDFNWNRRNRRHEEFYLPALHNETVGTIVVAMFLPMLTMITVLM
jgi:predicted metal-dependent peptidase